jgi:23S rRNA (cytosine1962-C5)-methyltransferase
MSGSVKMVELIAAAAKQRAFPHPETEAYRLFNGFYEGYPGLILDRYGPALVVLDHTDTGTVDPAPIITWALSELAGLEAVLHKQRLHPEEAFKRGVLIAGDRLPASINEFGVRYFLDLQLHQDTSFYLDTRNLRRWLLENMSGLRVLNTFAYTGSLGVAAGTGGAAQVVQTDLNKRYLHIAQRSRGLNHLPAGKSHSIPGDFFRVSGRFRSQDRLFDCVILDPPFFSTTVAGTVNLQGETTRLVNKVRPLVAHNGWLVLINNALFLSGADFKAELDRLCQSKYLEFERIIPVPPDITGFPETVTTPPPIDPAPFNHPTKIAILKVWRKDRRKSSVHT